MNNTGKRCEGVVLLSVLWVVTGLSVIVASGLTAVRTDIQLTQTHLRLAQGRALAEAGVYWAIYSLLEPRETPQPGIPAGPVELAWGDARVTLSIANESGKIDINTAGTRLIESVLERAGLDDAIARTVADELERDRQKAAAPESGDEDWQKRFHSVEDFVAGLDAPQEIKRRLVSRLTVYNGHDGVNPLAAGRETLLTVPGMSEGRVDTYLEQRRRQPFSTPEPGLHDRFFIDRLSSVYTIIARTRMDGTVSSIGSTVRLSSLRDAPFEILRWQSSVDFNQG